MPNKHISADVFRTASRHKNTGYASGLPNYEIRPLHLPAGLYAVLLDCVSPGRQEILNCRSVDVAFPDIV